VELARHRKALLLLGRAGTPAARSALVGITLASLIAPSLAFLAAPAAAATLTFTPDADSKVQQANPTTNYGGSTSLKVDGGADPVIESYLKFTVSGVTTPVSTATLRVFTSTTTKDGPAVYAASNSWTEKGVTYNIRPGRTSDASDDTGAVGSGVWVDLNVTPLVTGNNTYTFDLATSSTDGMTFSSREGTSLPQLVVTTATASDTGPPSVPGNVSASATSPYSVNVTWKPSTDDTSVAGYDIFRGGLLLKSVGPAAATYDDTTPSPSTTYSYTVEAIDGAGKRSGQSPPATATTPKDQAPSVPANLLATPASPRRVDLTWDGSSDDVGIDHYTVFRDSASIGRTQGPEASFSDTTAQPDTPYSYTVDAVDTAGQSSGQSDAASTRTPAAAVDNPPSIPGNVNATATSPYTIKVTWDASIDDTGLSSYTIYREGSRIDSVGPSTTSYVDSHVNPASTYSYTVEAVDSANQPSGQSSPPASATTPADTAPSIPANVKAAATTSTRVDVTWSASTDDVGVTNYKITRNGSPLATVGNVTTYADAAAKPGTAYTYTVEAFDTAGQGSGASAGSSLTTPDDPPSIPGNLKATAVSSTQVDLTWNASTDDVGVAGYIVVRDGAQAASVGAVTAYSDTTAKAGTRYSYQVQAVDTANQRSGLSTAAVATTPNGADPTVAAAGDIACASTTPTATQCRQQATADLLSDATAVLPLGDNQYDNGTLAEYQGSYALSWGRYFGKTFPVIGNHEYAVSADATGYFDYFGSLAGPRPQGWYSYNLGAWHLIALNANCSKIGGCDSASPQYKWLQADLAANPTKCTLAYWHQPLFGTGGGTSSVKPFWSLLYPAHADIVLNGHQHHYERFAPQTPSGTANAGGIREFVVGTGGKSHSGFGTTTPSATSQVRDSTTFGVLKLTLHATSYDWRFVPEVGKTFTDSGSGSCV
jgi:acid phosphatase type 7